MKSFFTLLVVGTALLCAGGPVVAQTDDYYKKDTTRDEPRQSTILLPEQERPASTRPASKTSNAPRPIIERLRLGGSFGLAFGNFTNINLSPMAGINLTENLLVGAGPTYILTSYRPFGAGASQRVTSSSYGGRMFVMYSPLPMVTLQAEYEGLNVQFYNITDRRFDRTWIGSPLIGGAYTQPLGGRFTRSVHMTLLYNLSYNTQLNPTSGQNISPYSSPIVFRVTFL